MIEDRFIGEHNEAADVTPAEENKAEGKSIDSTIDSQNIESEELSAPEEMGRLALDIQHLTKALEEAKTAEITFKNRLDGHDAYMLLEDEIAKMTDELKEKQDKLSSLEEKNGYNVIKEEV